MRAFVSPTPVPKAEIPLADQTTISYYEEMQGGAEVLRIAGQALYGERWQRPLSRDLGVTDRMIRYWAAGSHPSPAELNGKLVTLLKARGERLREIIAFIERKENGED